MHSEIKPIIELAAKVRRDLRRWIWLRGCAGVVVTSAAVTLTSLALDRFMHFDQVQRGMLLVIGLIITGLTGWLVLVRRLFQPLSDETILLKLQEKRPETGSKLILAYQFAVGAPKEGQSPVLIADSIEAGIGVASGLSGVDWVETRSRNRRCVMAGLSVLPWILILVAAPGVARLWAKRNLLLQPADWPRATTLEIVGAVDRRIRLPRGESREILINAEGEVPSQIFVDLRGRGRESRTVALARTGSGAFVYPLRAITGPLQIRARGGDHTTDWVSLDPADRPKVAQLAIRVTPPAYTAKETFTLPAHATQHDVPAGSRVEIVVHLDQPVEAWTLQCDKKISAHRDGTALTVVRHALEPGELRSGLYTFDATNGDGLTMRPPAAFRMLVRPDSPPLVKLKLLEASTSILPGTKLSLAVRVHDAFGIQSAGLTVSTRPGDGEEPESPLKGKTQALLLGQRDMAKGQAETRTAFDTSPLALKPGMRLYLQATAVDNNTLDGPGHGHSRVLRLDVIDTNQFLRELLEQEQEIGKALHNRVKAQEELLNRVDELSAKTSKARVRALEQSLRREARSTAAVREQVERVIQRLSRSPLPVEQRKVREERLREQAARPLEQVIKSQMPSVQKKLDEFRESEERKALRQAQQRQDDVVRSMRQIRNRFRTQTGAAEFVQELRELIQKTDKLREATEVEAKP